MDIQLIRERLREELANLPEGTVPELQSYTLTTAVLMRRITEALKINDLRIPDAWQRGNRHDLAGVLSKIVHYEDFSSAYVRPHAGESVRYDYVYMRSKQTKSAVVINLESYFDYVRCFAYDDVFVARCLLRRVDTLLSMVVYHPEKDFDAQLLADVVDRMYDLFTVLGKVVRRHALVVPTHRVINGYPEVHDAGRLILPGPVAERVPYGEVFAGYGTRYGAVWYRSIGRPEKYRVGRSEVYMVDVLRLRAGAPNAESVFFKLSDLLGMFKDLRRRLDCNQSVTTTPA